MIPTLIYLVLIDLLTWLLVHSCPQMPSELASFCTFVFKPFCSLKITFSVFWVLPHWVYLFLQTPSPHQISLKSFLLPLLPLSYWPCGFFGSYFLPYKINLLVLLDFSCGHVVWILFFLFFFNLPKKSYIFWVLGTRLAVGDPVGNTFLPMWSFLSRAITVQ